MQIPPDQLSAVLFLTLYQLFLFRLALATDDEPLCHRQQHNLSSVRAGRGWGLT